MSKQIQTLLIGGQAHGQVIQCLDQQPIKIPLQKESTRINQSTQKPPETIPLQIYQPSRFISQGQRYSIHKLQDDNSHSPAEIAAMITKSKISPL